MADSCAAPLAQLAPSANRAYNSIVLSTPSQANRRGFGNRVGLCATRNPGKLSF